MHVPTRTPDCHAEEATVRAPGMWDQGMACGNGMGAFKASNLRNTPGCATCARWIRAEAIEAGQIEAAPAIRASKE